MMKKRNRTIVMKTTRKRREESLKAKENAAVMTSMPLPGDTRRKGKPSFVMYLIQYRSSR
jgi:hypothetical protein